MSIQWRTLAWILSVSAGFGLIAMVLAPVFTRANDNRPKSSCQSNLKQISLGVMQYVQDYDGKYPLASTPSGGWVDAIYPYLKSARLFQCPTEPTWVEPAEVVGELPFAPKVTGLTDYYFNAQLQNRLEKSIGDQSRIISLGDGNDGQETTDASYSKPGIPVRWRTDSSSPAYRHLGGANYAFTDGHVKYFKVAEVSTNWEMNGYYFQPKKPSPTRSAPSRAR